MIDHEQVILLLLTAKLCSEVSDINTKLIKTQFSLQESLLNIWTKHFWIQFVFRYIYLQKIQM